MIYKDIKYGVYCLKGKKVKVRLIKPNYNKTIGDWSIYFDGQNTIIKKIKVCNIYLNTRFEFITSQECHNLARWIRRNNKL
jgi:hypothetical protein